MVFISLTSLSVRLEENILTYEKKEAAWNAFAGALAKLPSSSPNLRSYHYDGTFRYMITEGHEVPPQIDKCFNGMRFKNLESLTLRYYDAYFSAEQPYNCRPIIEAHPTLKRLETTLAHNRPFPPTCIPNLEEFVGTPRDCVTICTNNPPLKRLRLFMPQPSFDLRILAKRGGVWDNGDQNIVLQKLAAAALTLRSLHLFPGSTREQRDVGPRAWKTGLVPSYIGRVTKACPFLTDLEFQLQESLVSPSLFPRPMAHHL